MYISSFIIHIILCRSQLSHNKYHKHTTIPPDMMKLKTPILFIWASIFLLSSIPHSGLLAEATGGFDLKAYIYYTDGASCISNSDRISGTLIYAYNSNRMSGRGIVKENYHGPCKYFDGGHYDFMYQRSSGSGSSYMLDGYCIECNGMVGCTKTQNDCSDFQTSIPTNAYTSTGTNQQTNSSSTTVNVNATISLAVMDGVEASIYQEISGASSSARPDSFFLFALAGVGCGLMALVVSSTTVKMLRRKIQMKKKTSTISSIDSNELLKDGTSTSCSSTNSIRTSSSATSSTSSKHETNNLATFA